MQQGKRTKNNILRVFLLKKYIVTVKKKVVKRSTYIRDVYNGLSLNPTTMNFKKIAVFFLLGSCISLYGQERQLVWEENFDGSQLEQESWNSITGNGCPELCGWGNNELQFYSIENTKVANGFLNISAKKEGDTYTSGRINTKGKKEFQYGKIEVRAKLATGKGLWPAFWMLGSNRNEVGWPLCGEIDIVEYVGKEPETIFTTLHTADSHGVSKNTRKDVVEGIEEGFHIYSIDWTKEKIDFYIDNTLFYSFQPKNKNVEVWPFDQPFYIIINLAIGGNFGGMDVDENVFPQEFVLDYVRVYQ